MARLPATEKDYHSRESLRDSRARWNAWTFVGAPERVQTKHLLSNTHAKVSD